MVIPSLKTLWRTLMDSQYYVAHLFAASRTLRFAETSKYIGRYLAAPIHVRHNRPMFRHKPAVAIPDEIFVSSENSALAPSQAIEVGTPHAMPDALNEQWLSENAEVISAYNRDVTTRGVAIPPIWE